MVAGGIGTKIIRTSYPFTSGITAGTTKQAGRKLTLEPEGLNGKKTVLSDNDRVGIE